MQLRDYQSQAVAGVYAYLRDHDGNPLVVLPVGSGKSIVIAQIVKDVVERWQGRIAVVTHSAELVEQNADKIRRLCPGLAIGIHCAGLRRRDAEEAILCGSIQSLYRNACQIGPRDLIVVDECHAIPPDGDGMYRTFLSESKIVRPSVRVCGTTATPYRLSSGLICGPDQLFDDVCFEIGLKELISAGYLAPLVSKAGQSRVDTSQLRVRAGEFVAEEVESAMDQDTLVEAACAEIVELTQDRKACLIFASGVRHAQHVARVLQENHRQECGVVLGTTPAMERAGLLARFRDDPGDSLFGREPLKYLVNHGVLTTGFDCPRLDAVALLRPTMSPGLLVQMVGRATRLHDGKANALILDYGNNLLRHGPIDMIRAPKLSRKTNDGAPPAKECPQCRALIAAGYAVCPDCGHVFPPPETSKHDAQASNAGILSGQVTDTEYEVRDVTYSVHVKRNAPDDAPRSMRVDYRVGLDHWVSEWICFEHTGFARQKAESWWMQRSPDPIPETAEDAVTIADAGGVAIPDKIVVRSVAGEPFDRIVGCRLGEQPESVAADSYTVNLDDVPF